MRSLLKSRGQITLNRLRQLGTVKTLFLLLFALFLLASVTWIIGALFRYIAHEALFSDDFKLFICEKILQIAFMATFIMTVISALVACVNILYLSKDLPLLLSSPLPLGRLLSWKALEVAANSSFMAILLTLPLLIGYAMHFASSPGQLALITLGMLLLFAVAVLIGMLIGLILPAFFSIKTLQPVLSVFSVVLIAAAVIGLRLLRPEKLFAPESLDNLVGFMSQFNSGPGNTLPWGWLSMAIMETSKNNWLSSLWQLGKLALLVLLAWSFFQFLNRRYYLRTYEKLQQGKSRKNNPKSPHKATLISPFKALLKKEAAIFFRSTEQWSQLLVVLAILVIFVLNMQSLPFNLPILRLVLSFFTFGMGAFIIAGLNIRFTFTALPMEFPGVVHVLAAPVRRELIYRQKMFLHLAFHGLSALLLFLAIEIILKPDLFIAMSGGLFIFGSVPLFTAWALHASIDLTDGSSLSPQHLIISRQGIFYMIATFFHTTIMFALSIRPLVLFYRQQFLGIDLPLGEIGLWLILPALINLFLARWLYHRGLQRWRTLDF